MLRDMFYTGIGAATLFKERVDLEMKKLQDNGKIKTEDAKSFLESLEKKGKEEDEKVKDLFKKALKDVIGELDLATKEDIVKLKEEILSKV